MTNSRVKIYKTLKTYYDFLSKNYRVLFIGIYGSQNYNLDDENSDIDAKAIVLPTLKDIINKRSIKKIISMETGEIAVFDLMSYYQIIKKGNPAFIEPLHSKYKLGDKTLINYLAKNKVNQLACYGMMMQKCHALNHPYPSKLEIIAKFGYDPKQYHHIIRLWDLISLNDETKSFIEYNNLADTHYMKTIKRCGDNKPYDEVFKNSQLLCEKARDKLKDYKFKPIQDDDSFIELYIEKELKKLLVMKQNDIFVRKVRTFDDGIPKSDLKKFKKLEEYKDKDVSYLVYEALEIL